MIYHFGACTFDPARGTLRRAGMRINVEPKVLEVLHYLLRHRARVVTRDELFAQCWPAISVSDGALTSCLRRVREAIGQTQGGAPLIQTLHRRGYRFVAAVHEEMEPETPEVPLAPSQEPPVLASETSDELGQRMRESEPGTSSPPQSTTTAPALTAPTIPQGAGTSVLTPAGSALPTVQPAPAVTTERRHLTVLSCTLAHAPALSQQLDLEAHYELMQRFCATCMAIVAQYAGHVVQQFDDGLLVYFGYPQAHEDDAQRAVRSGLALIKALRQIMPAGLAAAQAGLAVRVGIDTGMMIVGAGASPAAPPYMGVGHTSTLAAHLGALAPPGTVVISAATAQVVVAYFECKALDAAVLSDGMLASQLAYEVRGASALQTRLEVEEVHGLTPFVGREAEVALLRERWTYVQEGLGQVVLVQGEAGMGKSCLAHVVKDLLIGELPIVWECRCSPYHENTALYPLTDLLQRAVYGPSTGAPEERLERLEALLTPYDVALEETVPLLAGLLSLPLPPGRYALLSLTPQRQRERTLDTLVSLLLAQAARSPLFFVVEDVHWADPSTVEFLRRLIDSVASVSLLVLLTCRPEYAVPWGQRSVLTRVVLHRLTRPQIDRMITQVAAGKGLPAAVQQQVREKTDGVPLFVEELTRMVVESGQLVEREGHYELRGALAELTIPATLHDSLLARLDRLGTAKDIAQWGAVLGREFSYGVLEVVTLYDAAELRTGLAQLVEAELVLQRGFLPQAYYRFKHALIQDAAYDSLLKRRRQAMHQRIAQVLEAQFTEMVVTQPEVLAHHYTTAGLPEQAIPYWQQAAQRALERSAYQETVGHLRTALTLLVTLPETPDRDRCELEIQLALGYPLEIVKGQGSPDMQQAYTRAQALCERVGDIPQHILALRGLHGCHLSRGALRTALSFAQQAFTLAQQEIGLAFLPLTHMSMAVTLYYLGDFAPARTHAEQGGVAHTTQSGPLNDDRNVSVCPVYEALCLWMLGYPERELQKSQTNIAHARAWDHHFRQVFTLTFTAQLYQFRREVPMVQTLAEEVLHICQKEWLPLYGAYATMLLGWVLAEQQQVTAGLERLHEGLTAYRTLQSTVSMPYWLSLQAEIYSKQGRVTDTAQVLTEALDLAARDAAGCWWLAELYRLKGELLKGVTCSPETCFQQALDIARRQQAKALELRAATSLARLWQQQDKRQAAHALLAPVYGWFSEGFDTADVQEAKALLTALA